jgi:hypothetical protein
MKNDYIPFQVQPVAGYTDLFSANDRLVQNNYDVFPPACQKSNELVEDDHFLEFGGVDVASAHILPADTGGRVTFGTTL